MSEPKLVVIFISILFLVSCSKDDSSAENKWCPENLATSSNLTVNESAQTAVPIHANGKDSTFFIQLSGTLNSSYSVDVYDVDLFDTSEATITALKSAGKKVICYFSAGSSEDWREDFNTFKSEDMGKPLDGWDGERWLDIRSQNVLDIMTSRLELAVEKGCDGVDPDNMDGYTQDSCFTITENEQLAYNRKIANLARSKGLSVGLKNDVAQIADLVNYFDFAVNEQCHQYDECDTYNPFTSANKPVFNLEYNDSYRQTSARNTLCSSSQAIDLITLIMDDYLRDEYVDFCN